MMKEKKYSTMPTAEKAELMGQWLVEKKAFQIKAMDLTGLNTLSECMLLCSARSVRHAQGLADYVLDMSKQQNIEYLRMEGYKNGQWILVDLNDVVVHIFFDDVRGFYNLEGLWSQAAEMFTMDGDEQTVTNEADDYYDWEDE